MKRTILTAFAIVASSASMAFAAPPPPIPEPGTFILLGLGAASLVAYKKFKK